MEVKNIKHTENLIGKQFNELTVVDKIENHSPKNNRVFIRWRCKCV